MEKTPNIEREKPQQLSDVIADYLVAQQILNELSDNGMRFLDASEQRAINHLELVTQKLSEKNGRKISTNQVLQTVATRLIDRKESGTPPKNPVDRSELKNLKQVIKREHILGLGERITDQIENSRIGGSLADANKQIEFAFARAYVDARPVFEAKGNYLDETARTEKLRDLSNLFNGMRHEAAFKEIIYEFNSDESAIFNVIETGREDELQGVDLKIGAHVVRDSDGSFRYPTAEEIQSGAIQTVEVPIDIKASQEAVNARLRQRSKYDYEDTGSLVMWSQIYNDDFRLGISSEDGQEEPVLKYDKDNARTYLSHSEQIEAMKRISEDGPLTYEYKGATVKPPALEARYEAIKAQILEYIADSDRRPLGRVAINIPVKSVA